MTVRVKSSLPKRKNYLPKSSVGVRKVNPKRRAKEWARAYGSKERVEWVKARPCCAYTSKCYGGSENHHYVNGGRGRKADADKIVPLCQFHHRWLHENGRSVFEVHYNVDLALVATETQVAWLEFSGESA